MALRRNEKVLFVKPLVTTTDEFGANVEGYGELKQFTANVYRETSELSLRMYGEAITDVKRLVTDYQLNLKDGVYLHHQLNHEPDYEVIDIQMYQRHFVVLIKKRVI